MTETVFIEGSGVVVDVKLDVWLRDILPRTPGCIRKVAKQELRNAGREFFTDSLTWRSTTRPKNVLASRTRYYLSPHDNNATVIRVFGVELNGVPLTPLTRKPGRAVSTQSTPTRYYLEAPDVVVIYPTPLVDLTEQLTFYVGLAPKMTVQCLPGIALSHFYDAILDGVLGRLYSHPAKPYSNPELAQYHLKRFQVAISRFAAEGKTGFAGALTWSFPTFAK